MKNSGYQKTTPQKSSMLLKLIVLSTLVVCSAKTHCEAAEEAKPWIEWDTVDGVNRLQTSESKVNFWSLSRFYECQIHPAYCGVASTVMALNALGVEAPESKLNKASKLFSQQEFFTEEVCKMINKEEMEKVGMSLNDLSGVLKAFPITFQVFEAKELAHDQIKSILVRALQNPKQIVLALYHRQPLGQQGMAHWSPLAAHDSVTDSFLIMDVARYKYPPVWANATELFNAMQTTNVKGKSRGFIIIEKGK